MHFSTVKKSYADPNLSRTGAMHKDINNLKNNLISSEKVYEIVGKLSLQISQESRVLVTKLKVGSNDNIFIAKFITDNKIKLIYNI